MIAGKKSFPSPSTRESEGDGEPGGDKHRPYSSEKILSPKHQIPSISSQLSVPLSAEKVGG